MWRYGKKLGGFVNKPSKKIEKLERIVGKEDLFRLIYLFSAENVYLPKAEFNRIRRNEYIFDGFKNGKTPAELAKEHRLSVRQIYNIIHTQLSKKI